MFIHFNMTINFLQKLFLLTIVSLFLQACVDSKGTGLKQGGAHTRITENPALQTNEPGRFLEQLLNKGTNLAKTLIIFDLDDTIITSPEGQWLGKSEMFYDFLNTEISKAPEKSKKEVAETIDPLLVEVYKRVPVILTDKHLPKVIKQAKQNGALIIGMTARGQPLWDVTLEQLKRTGIQFSDISSSEPVPIDNNRSIIFNGGLAMVSHGNTKGEALEALIKSNNLPFKLDLIIMIDDKQSHLDTVAKTVTYLTQSYTKIAFMPILCTYPQSVNQYNSSEAIQQLEEFLLKWQKDSEITKLIGNDPFTRNFLYQCASGSSSNAKQCKQLLLP